MYSLTKTVRQCDKQCRSASPADIYQAEDRQTAEAWAWADSDCGPYQVSVHAHTPGRLDDPKREAAPVDAPTTPCCPKRARFTHTEDLP